MKRTFPSLFTVGATNTAQPLVGTLLTANVSSGGSVPVSIPVASSAIFRVNDRVEIGIGSSVAEITFVNTIPDSTHITAIIKNAHNNVANNNSIALHQAIAGLYVQPSAGDSGILYLGNNIAMSNNSYLVKALTNVAANVQPYDWNDDEQGSGINPLNTREYWAYGTANDTYNVVLTII